MKKLISIFLTAAICLCLFTACGQTEPEITETAPETAIVTTTTASPEVAVTTPTETTILTTTTETTPPETEPTTTASITTADNSSDTRSTQQKLDDIIAANPDVEIGYALYNPNTNKYLYHYNDEMEIDVSGEVPVYWLYMVLEQNVLESEVRAYLEEKDEYSNSYIYELYMQEVYQFKVIDLINYYYYDEDLAAKRTLERREPLTYGAGINIEDVRVHIRENDSLDKSSILEYLAKWVNMSDFLNVDSEEAQFFSELLTNNDRDSFFYEGTGVLVPHVGDEIDGQFYDTGVIKADGVDYIYVIYTKNTESADIVREISRYFYDDLT
jgi:hypothetical protein